MKKYLAYFMALLVFSMMACSSDDENGNVSEQVSQKLTSTVWHRVSARGDNKCFEYLKFLKNGKCCYGDYLSNGRIEWRNDSLIWTYNVENKMLRMYRADGYYTYHFNLEFEDNGDWIGTDNTRTTTAVVIYTPYKESEE